MTPYTGHLPLTSPTSPNPRDAYYHKNKYRGHYLTTRNIINMLAYTGVMDIGRDLSSFRSAMTLTMFLVLF